MFCWLCLEDALKAGLGEDKAIDLMEAKAKAEEEPLIPRDGLYYCAPHYVLLSVTAKRKAMPRALKEEKGKVI